MQHAARFYGKKDRFLASLEEEALERSRRTKRNLRGNKRPTPQWNLSVTENGAIGYRTSGSLLLDINFSATSMRRMKDQAIESKFIKAFYENRLLAVKWLFYLRDRKEGLGERRSFRVCLNYLAESHEELAEALIPLIPEYGRFDDLLVFLETDLAGQVCQYMRRQLDCDLTAVEAGGPVSLLAKWLPSATASAAETRTLAAKAAKGMGFRIRTYRRILSKLRSYMKVTEREMSDRAWKRISYDKVPAKANLRYDGAFYRHDRERREQYLDALANSSEGIHVSHLMPYEIVHRYMKRLNDNRFLCCLENTDIMTEVMWRKLIRQGVEQEAEAGLERVIVVADGSGSMTSAISQESGVTALEVANSLAIYFASSLCGAYRDRYITFSSHPQMVDLSWGRNLKEKLEIALAYDEIANTNIEAVFDLILKTAVDNQMKQEELPEGVLILSDMEFDMAVSAPVTARLFDQMEARFQAAGYELPRLIFWNLCGRTGTIPMTDNGRGLSLISGFSQNAISAALGYYIQEDEETKKEYRVHPEDAYEALKLCLSQARYEPVEKIVDPLLKSA